MLRKKINFFILLILSILGTDSIVAQKIFMMGDSHVGSKIYPDNVREMINTKFPDAQFKYWFKNGLRFSNFSSTPDYYNKISSFDTDILILNLGTNEAYTDRFSSSNFKKHLESFYNGLIKKMPDIKVVFITPYTNKLKVNGIFKVNNNNRLVADDILEFVAAHPNTYAIDINEKIGTQFIDSPKLIRDNAHLTVEGYRILGRQVGEDLLEIEPLWITYLPHQQL